MTLRNPNMIFKTFFKRLKVIGILHMILKTIYLNIPKNKSYNQFIMFGHSFFLIGSVTFYNYSI